LKHDAMKHSNVKLFCCGKDVLKISNINTMFQDISRDVPLDWDLLFGDLYISCIYLLIDTNIFYICGTVLSHCFVSSDVFYD